MAGLYSMTNLLELLLREGAGELHLLAEHPPMIIKRGEPILVDACSLNSSDVAQLLRHIATGSQLDELNACGNAHFIYLFQNSARFAVTASMNREALDVKIKNLGR